MATKTKPKKARKAKAKAPAIPLEELTEALEREGKLEDEIRRHEAKIEELRQSFKGEKELKAGKLAELRQLIWERNHPEAHPLYSAKPSANGKAHAETPASAPAQPAEDDSWRNVKLEDLTDPPIPKSILQKLNDAQLYTLGELTNWTAADGGRKRITDIPGVGTQAAEKIEAATTAFWERRSKAMAVVAKVAGGTDPAVEPKPGEVIDAEFQVVADPLEAARDVLLKDLAPIKERSPLMGRLHMQSIKTVGDLLDRAKGANVSPLDYLRGYDLNPAEADMVLDAAKAASGVTAAEGGDKPVSRKQRGNRGRRVGRRAKKD